MATTMVTGATGGIGSAVLRRFRDRGDDVIALGRDADRLKALDAQPVVLDLTRTQDIEPTLTPALPESLDVLVHCAGVIDLAPIGRTSAASWIEQLTVNLVAAAEITRLCLPALRKAGGHVLFLNAYSHGVQPGWGAYTASKVGLHTLAETLRDEEDRYGVGVTTIYPACTATEMQRGIREGHGRKYKPELYIQPETLAELVLRTVETPADARVTDLTVTMSSLRNAR
ncbi:MAG: SDR family NAD(P)-dependent oxidoreductase [Actinocatenispora sp.]